MVEQGLGEPPATARSAQTVPDVTPPGDQPPARDGDPVVLASGALRLQWPAPGINTFLVNPALSRLES
jgi:hypothetical protein